MKLVERWKSAYRFISVQAMAAAMALLGVWEAFPDDLKDDIPHQYVTWAAMALLVLGVAGRLVKQGEKPKDEAP